MRERRLVRDIKPRDLVGQVAERTIRDLEAADQQWAQESDKSSDALGLAVSADLSCRVKDLRTFPPVILRGATSGIGKIPNEAIDLWDKENEGHDARMTAMALP